MDRQKYFKKQRIELSALIVSGEETGCLLSPFLVYLKLPIPKITAALRDRQRGPLQCSSSVFKEAAELGTKES